LQEAQVDKYLKSREPGKPKVFEVNYLDQFVDLATYFDQKVIFRGQTKDWQLVPSLGRDIERSHFPWEEEETLEEFRRESIPYINFIPKTKWQWLALAQHSGLPTRLLDWTKNPLAALWFAVKDPAICNSPGVVWVLHYERSDIYNNALPDSPFTIDRTFLYFPEHIFPFIQAQTSAFTVHHQQGENPVCFSPFEQSKDSDLLLSKIEISGQFATICYQLFRIGISPASLFPGLPGLVEKMRYDKMLRKDEGNALSGN
jgi:hypothetical protein